MSRKNQTTRKRILDAAWKMLEDGGASQVRMSDIAKSAGISRQALYLHFPTRADLLIAVTRHIDEVKDIDVRLAASRAATTGQERLTEFIAAWGDYLPEIHGIARAMIAMQDSDAAARAAWTDRMQALRHGCEAAVRALDADGDLTSRLGVTEATDLLWTLLSVQNWEQLTRTCGWSQSEYIGRITATARAALLCG